MANEEHLKILKQGVEVWNRWRGENPETRPDLVDADLIGTDFVGMNLRGSDLAHRVGFFALSACHTHGHNSLPSRWGVWEGLCERQP